MPTTKASKTKKVKAGKGKKDGKQESKVDKESDVEKAKANAALWELRLKVTSQSLSESEKTCYKLSCANETLTKQLDRAEKDDILLTAFWEGQLAAKEDKIRMLQETLRGQEALARKEKNQLLFSIFQLLLHDGKMESNELLEMKKEVSDLNMVQEGMKKMKEREAQMEHELLDMKERMDIADEEHIEDINKMENKFIEEKARLEREIMEQCNRKMAFMETDHHEATVQLEGALHAVLKERDHLNEALKYHKKEAEDLQKLTNSLAKENTSLRLDKNMFELIVKKNAAQMEAQKKNLSELRTKVASLEQAQELKAKELELQEKEKKMNLVTIQASQIELEKLQKVLAMREKELGHIKELASTIVKKRRDLEEFFHEALAHVRKEITTSQAKYKKEALQDYRLRFREATAGKIKFPPIRTFHKSPHSTNSVYSDMEAAAIWTYPPGSEVEFSDLTWEQKEQVLMLLFAKMNTQKERIREELSPTTISAQAPESILPSNPNSLPDIHIT